MKLLVGGIVANLAAVALVVGAWALSLQTGFQSSIITILNVFLLPVFVGMVAAWFWRKLRLTLGSLILHSIWLAGFGFLGAAVVFHEGLICLIMIAPLYYVIVFLSVSASYYFFRNNSGKMRISVIPMVVGVDRKSVV